MKVKKILVLVTIALVLASGCTKKTDQVNPEAQDNTQQLSGQEMPTDANADHAGNNQVAKESIEGIAKAENGHTIQDIYAMKGKIDNTAITVRGKVVKFSPNIMGKNWVHIQDGTGDDKSFDLTVTTAQEVAVGSTVLVNGTVQYDKDFGSGYKYDVIIEEATLTEEAAAAAATTEQAAPTTGEQAPAEAPAEAAAEQAPTEKAAE